MKESTIPDLLTVPVNIQWEKGEPAPMARHRHAAVFFNGMIYVGGGWSKVNDKIQYPHTLDMYRLNTNSWNTIDTPHKSFAITVLTNKVVIVGGVKTNDNMVTNNVLVLESDQWKDYTKMPTARLGSTAFSYQSMMIVMGGVEHTDTISTTELFDETTGQWFKCDDLPQPLRYPHSVIVGNMVILSRGITEDNNALGAVYTAPLDTLSSHQVKWQYLKETPFTSAAAGSLNNKYLLAASDKNIYVLDTTTTMCEWMTIASLPVQINNTAVVCYDNSRLVIIGGYRKKSINEVWIGSFQY